MKVLVDLGEVLDARDAKIEYKVFTSNAKRSIGQWDNALRFK